MNEEALTKIVVDLNTVAARLEAVASRIDRAQASAPQGAPRQSGGGGGNRPSEPMTDAQSRALFAISGAQKKFKINDVCQQQFGKDERHLSKQEASKLIEGLKNGSIVPGGAQTAGIEAVTDAFPGAQSIGHPEEVYNGAPF